MTENEYPRLVGSDTIVKEEEWNQGAPFGHCPACGSTGMEELSIPGDPDITFFCSDENCRTVQHGRSRPARTKWTDDKPSNMQEREEEEEWSWNEEHFPGWDIPEVCPD